MDTVLMAIFVLHKYVGSSEAGDSEVLRNVLVLIKEEEYDRARFIWCTKVLGFPPAGDHDLFGSIGIHIDSSQLRSLFTFTTSYDPSTTPSSVLSSIVSPLAPPL